MKGLLIVLLFAASPSAHGADFRGLEFGSPCGDLAARELARGSKIDTYPDGRKDPLRIRTVHLGGEAEVLYKCGDESQILFGGLYIFHFGTYEEAAAFYVAARSMLIAELGDPYQDSMTAEYFDAMQRVAVPIDDTNRYLALWAFPTHTISMNGSRLSNDSSKSWVIIRYTPKT